ncbi:MAG: rnhA operon protein [Halodesulfurarchaeum sp.]
MTHLPDDVRDAALELTRTARRVEDADRQMRLLARRDRLLDDHGFLAHLRDGPKRTVLVCYPTSWQDEEGVVDPDRVDDPDQAVELPLYGRETGEDYTDAEEYNRELVRTVEEQYGSPHAETAAAFADFMSNHHATRIDEATAAHVEEFETDYFPRNAWPSEEQRRALQESLEYVFDVAGQSTVLD